MNHRISGTYKGILGPFPHFNVRGGPAGAFSLQMTCNPVSQVVEKKKKLLKNMNAGLV